MITKELNDNDLTQVTGGSNSKPQYRAMCYDCPWSQRADDLTGAQEAAEKHRRSTGHQTGTVQ